LATHILKKGVQICDFEENTAREYLKNKFTSLKVKSVKNIIFDFGGVIFNISHEKVENAYRKLGMDNFELLFNKATQDDLFRNFEKGEITPDEFRKQLREISGLQVDDVTLDSTWNEILCDYPPHRITLLKEMRQNYKLFLLSNTNAIHYRHYTALFRKEFGHDFNDLFDDTFWSFKIGLRKPDPDPYRYILQKHELDPRETLFIDDSIQNIVAAENLDILAYHLEGDMSEIFENGFIREGIIKGLNENNRNTGTIR